jgi:hypothetical protein
MLALELAECQNEPSTLGALRQAKLSRSGCDFVTALPISVTKSR